LDCPGFDSYAWSNGSSSASIQVTGGIYSVTVTDSNGCVGSDTASPALGMVHTLASQLSVGPNPTKDVVCITNLPRDEAVALRVLTNSGVEVRRSNAEGTSPQIDLSGLPNGHYFLQIRSDHSFVSVGIIKLK
ncbi:MAG: T9SS type A sorting domain-containing protein, partial [Cryomorphaceae bacterium]